MNDEISIDSVFLYRRERPIFEGVGLSLKSSSVTALLGRNGSGKSCLLRVLFGELKPQFGHIRYAGEQTDRLYLTEDLINYLPQYTMHPKRQTLQKLLYFYGIDKDSFLGQYPLFQEVITKRFGHLSGGEKRLFEILCVLEQKTKFTLLDEPFTHVMPMHIQLVKNRIKELSTKKGIMITDHQYEHVLELAQYGYLISNNGILTIRDKKDLVKYGYLKQ